MVNMYVKISLSDGVRKLDYCFMKPFVEFNELSKKVKELMTELNTKNDIVLSIGY